MNYAMVAYFLGSILKFEAAFLALPCIVALYYGEASGLAYLAVALVCLAGGLLITRKKPKSTVFYTKEGFMSVALGWILISAMGALPFVICGDIPNYVNAIFETISGFTTTGASILSDVERLTHCSLFWRSFTHWVGGMGFIVFVLAVSPMAGGSDINLLRAESPGPSVDKLVPKVRQSAMILYAIYIFLTVLQVVILLFAGMKLFDSLCVSFGTAGTGGFAVLNTSFATYTPAVQTIVTVFMILFGVNFSFYYLLLMRRFGQAVKMEEVRVYIIIILAAIALITVNIMPLYNGFSDSLLHSAFQVGSIMTTTGFSTVDFNQWPSLSRTILVLLMFIGACAGSTGGGIKVARVVMLTKSVKNELGSLVHPRIVTKVRLDGRTVGRDVLRTVHVFLFAYVAVFAVSVIILAFNGYDFTTNFTAVAATMNNIGPGLELVGPASNFGFFSVISKIVLMFDMLAGRLEIFPMLLLFSPYAWRSR